MATPKQEKLIKLLLENLGTGNNTRTLGEMLLEAGYSENQAKNPYQILETKAVKEGLADVAKDIDSLRGDVLNEMKSRDISNERYSDLVKALDLLTKNHQLLTGGETERNTKQPLLVKIIGKDGDANSS